MVISPLILCNSILYRAIKEHVDVSPMKLQKLLYFVCKDYLQHTKQPIISEPFSVWKYGPVSSTVYAEFKTFGAKLIKKYA